MALQIIIYGANCSKCNKMTERFQKVVALNTVDANIEKVTDTSAMLKANIYSVPAVMINGEIVSKGIALTGRDIIKLLNTFLPEDEKIAIGTLTKKTNKKLVLLIVLLLLCAGCIATWYFNSSQNDNNIKLISEAPMKMNLADSLYLLYNYSKNNSTFELTFLEFGSKGCVECKKMEKVMEEVSTNYKGMVNVVFYDVRIKENKKITEHFGIEIIPVQVLLDKNGKEFFRHVGFYSAKDLSEEIEKKALVHV